MVLSYLNVTENKKIVNHFKDHTGPYEGETGNIKDHTGPYEGETGNLNAKFKCCSC
jgi:hypothetical protein